MTTTARSHYRLGALVALGTVLFLLFGIGALGIIGSGGRPDRMYLAVIAVAVAGAVVTRLRPSGMALTLLATAVATMVVGVVAIAAGHHHDEGASVLEILGLSGMYAAMFGLSAWLFRQAAEPRPTSHIGAGA